MDCWLLDKNEWSEFQKKKLMCNFPLYYWDPNPRPVGWGLKVIKEEEVGLVG
jgi:hypothetical protein